MFFELLIAPVTEVLLGLLENFLQAMTGPYPMVDGMIGKALQLGLLDEGKLPVFCRVKTGEPQQFQLGHIWTEHAVGRKRHLVTKGTNGILAILSIQSQLNEGIDRFNGAQHPLSQLDFILGLLNPALLPPTDAEQNIYLAVTPGELIEAFLVHSPAQGIFPMKVVIQKPVNRLNFKIIRARLHKGLAAAGARGPVVFLEALPFAPVPSLVGGQKIKG